MQSIFDEAESEQAAAPSEAQSHSTESVRALCDSLDVFGYKYWVNPEESDFRFFVRTVCQDWKSRILLTPPTKVVRLFVEVSKPYPSERLPWVAELVHRVNTEIASLGGFDFDYSTGAAYFRFGVDFSGQAVTVDAITRMLNASSWQLEFFRTAFGLIDTKYSPAKAVDIALMMHDCGEIAHDPKSALKTILHIESGDNSEASTGEGEFPPSLRLV